MLSRGRSARRRDRPRPGRRSPRRGRRVLRKDRSGGGGGRSCAGILLRMAFDFRDNSGRDVVGEDVGCPLLGDFFDRGAGRRRRRSARPAPGWPAPAGSICAGPRCTARPIARRPQPAPAAATPRPPPHVRGLFAPTWKASPGRSAAASGRRAGPGASGTFARRPPLPPDRTRARSHRRRGCGLAGRAGPSSAATAAPPSRRAAACVSSSCTARASRIASSAAMPACAIPQPPPRIDHGRRRGRSVKFAPIVGHLRHTGWDTAK